MSYELSEKQDRARKWVHGYVAAGTLIVVAAVIPGSTSVALVAMEVTMCYHIGKIYKGDAYDLQDAVKAAKIIGLIAVAAQLAALEALSLIPFAGWLVKAGIAGGVIKGLGEAIIKFYEKQEEQECLTLRQASANSIEIQSTITALPASSPPPDEVKMLPPVATAIPETSMETRLSRLKSYLEKKIITPEEYAAKRQQILSEI